MEIELNIKQSSELSDLFNFIDQPSFPCIMAKAVAKTGLLDAHVEEEIESHLSQKSVLNDLYHFVDEFRAQPDRLSSFTLILKNPEYLSFDHFEKIFWQFLRSVNVMDKAIYPHDPRVGSEVMDNDYSFSLKSEAFFILALHPQSPRWARRFKYPAIVLNPHVQFENLRLKNVFKKVQNVIRTKDKLLQGFINPMLNDFGEKSEVFQYTGRAYAPSEKLSLYL